MRKLFRNILLPLLAFAALALLIWFVGPLFVFAGWAPLEHPVSRIVLFLVLLSLWIARKAQRHFAARRANAELAQEMVADDPSEERSREEVQLLKERLEDALEVLKTSKLGGEGQSLYELPWYIIIGPPGSGKTTALVNSGLRFPLADKFGQDSLQGVGGTRNCDWWFTDEAVLVDTAGRYTTQDSNREQDAAAWTGFLKLLKKHRKRRPINGALVAISVSELLSQSQAERQSHARIIRNRIQELHAELGIRFPVYVILTKCDLLAGFSEFFDDLRKDQREQVWGMTFELRNERDYSPVSDQLGPCFEALERRLNEHLLERLEYERAPQRRDLIYAFPQQLSALRNMLDTFLGDIFRPSRYEEVPLLRGVYFTSGTQEGTPIDRVLGAIASTFGVSAQVQPAFSGRGRSYFLTRLLRDVVFEESGLAGTNVREERRRAWLQRAAYGVCLLLMVAGAVAWAVSYQRNQTYLDSVTQSVEDSRVELRLLEETTQTYASVLPSLNAVRAVPYGYGEREADVPTTMRFGLFQGSKLGSEADRTYLRLLHNVLLPQMVFELEDTLRRGRDDRSLLYDTLRVYLMLSFPQHFDQESVENWFLESWIGPRPPPGLDIYDLEVLAVHLSALLGELKDPLPVGLDEDLIERTRRTLRQLPLAERLLANLKAEVRNNDKVKDFRIDEAAGDGADIVFVRRSGKSLSEGLSGLYTFDGYKGLVIPESRRLALETLKEQWILGETATLEDTVETARRVDALLDEMFRLYFDEYVIHWDRLLADIDIASFGDAQGGLDILREIIRGEFSPLRKLALAIGRETRLSQQSEFETALRDAAADEANRAIRNRLSRLLRSGAASRVDVRQDQNNVPLTPVEEHFGELIRLVEAEDGNRPEIDSLLNRVDAVHDYVFDLVDNVPTTGSSNPSRTLRTAASRKPQPVRRWLESLAIQTQRLAGGGTEVRLDQSWVRTVQPNCQKVVSNRFPFNRDALDSASLRDFGLLFGHGGLIDNYFKQNLERYIDKTSSPWRWRPAGPGMPRLSPRSAAAFEEAARIRDGFFQGGGQNPTVSFELTPIFLDSRIETFILNFGGDQRIVYRHGPALPTKIRWPGDSDFNQIQIQISPPSPRGRSTVVEDGPWAWFRLLDASTIQDDSDPDSFIVRFGVDGLEAAFRVRTESAINPFIASALAEFTCPGAL
ncbi:MAG: type VI secretion system membrane subunit TssM [Xanthomonadales bacterium]|nr:type VI secretion system membrane subunit TssM [Xanthomonadales bacterium]